MKRIISLILVLIMISIPLTSCQKNGNGKTTTPPAVSTTEANVTTSPDKDAKVFNIIYALATVPPVLAAIDSIGNGYETYAIVERGKTYSGIENLEYFHNAGFDTANNESSGLAQDKLDAMVAKVKELNDSNQNTFFNFYAQDGTALSCAAIAANAGVKKNNFHVYMCEDGTGAYVALRDRYISSKVVNAEKDEPYSTYKLYAEDAKARFDTVMSKKNNKSADKTLEYNIPLAFGLASLPNFTYWLQDKSALENVLNSTGESKTLLLSSFGFEGYTGNMTSDYKLNLRFEKISEGISALTEKQRTDYLMLMYGSYYSDTYSALTRTERGGEAAPADKLIFIGARYSYYPTFASDDSYGIGGLKEGEFVPANYASLDEKYKNALLFPTADDYNAFLSVINSSSAYSADVEEAAKDAAKRAAFNLYIDYIYTLKFTYALYGGDYDIIMKGHPRESLGSSNEWGSRYKVKYDGEKEYVFDKLLDMLLLEFHKSDSVGKKIGLVPFGTAAENLAYLGVGVSICGLPSSTYSGYDPDVDVLFVMAKTDEDITGDTSQVKDRFLAGNLTFKQGEEELNCVYYNSGNTLKFASKILKDNGNSTASTAFDTLYKAWLTSARGGASDIDAQGASVIK